MQEKITKLGSICERKRIGKIGLGRIDKLYEHWY